MAVACAPFLAGALDSAWRVETPLSARYSLNGPWERRGDLPHGRWERARLPENMPGRGAAFCYRRRIRIPSEASGRRAIMFFSLTTGVEVRIDGRTVGSVDWPGGELDVTGAVRPGTVQIVELSASYDRWGGGVTSDFYLDLVPAGVRIAHGWVDGFTTGGAMDFHAELAGDPMTGIALRAEIAGNGGRKTFHSGPLTPDSSGHVSFHVTWPDVQTWDFNATSNIYSCVLSVFDGASRCLDAAIPFKFGFRDLRLSGNRMLLNGSPIHLRFLHAPVAATGNSDSNFDAAQETCGRLRGEGYNALSDLYGVPRGAYTHLEGIWRACDELGLAYFFTLPHVRDFGGEAFASNASEQARYRRLATHLIRMARRHPCVFAYAMNHNYAGYPTEADPLRIDGKHPPEKDPLCRGKFEATRRQAAHRAWEIVKEIDPTCICYHHSAGDLDDLYTCNVYLDWAPRQERSDWLEHWSRHGTKPFLAVEWGNPHLANWSSYRGPGFVWDTEQFQSIVAAEAAAAFFGDRAYEDSEAARKVLDSEERLWAKGRPWSWRHVQHFDVLVLTNSLHAVQAHYLEDNLRCMRAWGITGILPWDQRQTMHLRVAPTPVIKNPDALEQPCAPGTVADHLSVPRDQYIMDRGARTNWVRTAVGETIARWNQDDCCFIGGDPVFTDKRHIYRAGDSAVKRLVFVNDCRSERTYSWTVKLLAAGESEAWRQVGETRIPAGTRGEARITIPLAMAGEFTAEAVFSATGWQGCDRFQFSVLPPEPGSADDEPIPLYDPHGDTARNFKRLGIPFKLVGDVADAVTAAREKALVVGRNALDVQLVQGLFSRDFNEGHMLVFEQSKTTLESLGFRVQEYGLRSAFARFKDGDVKLADETLRDWAGESTLIQSHMPPSGSVPHAVWAGYNVDRVWRCGNRGAVATVIPEKPTAGDWRALADGGWNLQYAPLLDWRVDFAHVTFCQFDVTGRTVADPAADDLVRALVARIRHEAGKRLPATWAILSGKMAYMHVREMDLGGIFGPTTRKRDVFFATSGGEKPADLDQRVSEEGVRVVCAGMDAAETKSWAPVPVTVIDAKGRHFERMEIVPRELNGCSNAEWAWHGRMDYAAFSKDSPGDGNSAIRVIRHGKGYYVFVQVAPWMIDDKGRPYLRSTRRRATYLLNRILGNAGMSSRNTCARYADVPVFDDDPYRFFPW
ncbi:MAG: hypothetical protein IKO72_09385 [Kiritimatiellae bacterium]|nr:hypothetical protein [Kiritimatiellia bacterium]